MGVGRIICAGSSRFGASALLPCILVFMSTVQAQLHPVFYTGHVSIANLFNSPTFITCYSYVKSRATYSAIPGEVYLISFNIDVDGNQFWDCQIDNPNWGRRAVFRFYGNRSHGAREVHNCEDCIWKVDPCGVYIFLDAQWWFKYSWPRRGTQPEEITPEAA